MVDEDHVDIHRQPQQNLDGQVQSGAALHRELRLLENNPNRLEQIISPSLVLEGIATAIPAGEAAANRQFANHWERHTEGDWGKPGGGGGTLDDKLPVERLHSPGSTEWFIELLTVPEPELDLGENVADGTPITRRAIQASHSIMAGL